tara:strand:- start:143 stop:574 length:432 start_codon:yes stop_codon:yes gene_type:complete
MNIEAKRIADYLYDISGVDVFENKRTRYNIEARSLLNFILRNHFDMTFHQIKEFYEKNGKRYDHATAMHSLKSFEVHRKYSKFLDKWLDDIQLLMKDKTNIRKGLLINTLETFNHTEITKLYKVVNKIRDGKEQKEKKRDTPV